MKVIEEIGFMVSARTASDIVIVILLNDFARGVW